MSALVNVDVGGVPNFLLKLLNLLEDEAFQQHISWSADGSTFVIHDQAAVAKLVLPKFFKHNKFASFVRQLNMYGFRKVPAALNAGIERADRDSIVFQHPLFVRNRPEMLQHIKRKAPQQQHSVKVSGDELLQVLDDVQDIKGAQSTVSHSLGELKRENEDLWREIVSLRQKHTQQQKVVNRLIQFLVTLVQHHGVGVKRKFPLMIGDGSEVETSASPSDAIHPKIRKINKPPTPAATDFAATAQGNVADGHVTLAGESGPQITELRSSNLNLAYFPKKEQMVSSVAAPTLLPPDDAKTSDSFDISDLIRFDERQEPVQETATDLSTPTSSQVNDLFESLVQSPPPDSQPEPTSSSQQLVVAQPSTVQLSDNFNNIQTGLDRVQNKLCGNERLVLDHDLVQELFHSSMDISPLPTNIFDYVVTSPSTLPVAPSHKLDDDDITGKELVQYNPVVPVDDSDIDLFKFYD